jgi:hypothetical protein
MKITILSFMFIALASQTPVQAEDSKYQAELRQARERLQPLEIERADYRKITQEERRPKLAPAQEAERYRLLGQLLNDDPVWAVAQQIQADLSALVAVIPRPLADAAIVDDLKDLLAITSGLEDRATTQAQAEEFATALRQFLARRDVTGARAWARAQ